MSKVIFVGDIYYSELYPNQGLPPSGGHPSQPIFHPGHPDHGLPSGGHPSQPIFHPGHPDHGLPSSPGHPSHQPVWGGRPVDPGYGQGGSGSIDNSLPNIPGLPDQSLPPAEQLPPDAIQLPEPPPDYSDDLIVAVHRPGATDWVVSTFDVGNYPDQGLPPQPAYPSQGLPPTPAPKKAK